MLAPKAPIALPWADTPTLLAPMEGVTHPHFRHFIGGLGGVGMLCTEFFRIHEHAPVQRVAETVVKTPGVPLSVQVMGRDLRRMALAAQLVSEAGADAIDINMGCPTRNAVKGGVGAAMLQDPDLLQAVVAAMREKTQGFLSAKIRAGFDHSRDVLKNARIVQDSGADYIAVHPRRRVDHYKGVADWRIVQLLKKELDIPVIGNGDIWYAKDALKLMEESGCDAVMIGRPALRNPWIFSQIQSLLKGQAPYQPSGEDCLSYLEYVASEKRKPGRKKREGQEGKAVMGRLKEHLGYLCRAVPDEGALRRKALRAQSVDEIFDHLRQGLLHLGPKDLDLLHDGHLGLERSAALA